MKNLTKQQILELNVKMEKLVELVKGDAGAMRHVVRLAGLNNRSVQSFISTLELIKIDSSLEESKEICQQMIDQVNQWVYDGLVDETRPSKPALVITNAEIGVDVKTGDCQSQLEMSFEGIKFSSGNKSLEIGSIKVSGTSEIKDLFLQIKAMLKEE